MKSWWLLLLVCLIAVGCSGSGNKKQPSDDASSNRGKTPPVKGKQADDNDPASTVPASQPVDPVHFSKLIPFLPAPPKGFKAEEARGDSVDHAGFKISQAENTYRADDKDVRVQIVDGAFIPSYYQAFDMARKFSHDSSEGYSKGVSIGGNPGVEHWKKNDQNSELIILVGKRFLVSIHGNNVPIGTVREVYASIDATKLAGLK